MNGANREKTAWDEIENAIRGHRDARMEQWQGIRPRAPDRRGERIEQWQDFRGRAQGGVREGEKTRGGLEQFFKQCGECLFRDWRAAAGAGRTTAGLLSQRARPAAQ